MTASIIGSFDDTKLRYLLDRQLFHAVREDNENMFVEVCGDGEVATLDINYIDGCAVWG